MRERLNGDPEVNIRSAYRQYGMTSIKIKGLHQADVHCTNQSDFFQIHQHNPTFEELKFKKKELNL